MGELAKLHSDLEALVGKLIHDRYRVDSLLGVGGMGAVFKGYHTGLKREVAIKLLHPEIGRDESVSKRFDREAYSASRLDHPNCVRVSDFGTTESGAKYLVMEFLEGAELEATLGKPWPALEAVRVAKQIFAGLEHAHHFNVVHRDLKPENVFVTTDFRGQQLVKLVDFGIAKLLDGDGTQQEKLTRAGLVFGTPRYMSPEQAAGGKIDERTDLYAAGLIVYEMLAGNPPFDAEEPGQLLRMHIMAPPPPLPSGLPAGLLAVVDKLLEKSKSDRYSTAREVLDALDVIERELLAGPVAVAPVVVAPVVVAPVEVVVEAVPPVAALGPTGRPKTGWQPAVPTTSLPSSPPPDPRFPTPSVAMTMPMIVGPVGPSGLPSSFQAPTGSHPSLSLSNASTSASQTWATSSAAMASVSASPSITGAQPTQRRSIVPWVIAGAALLIASLSAAALIWTMQNDALTDPAAPDAQPIEEAAASEIQPAAGGSGSAIDPPTEPVAADPPPRTAPTPTPTPKTEPTKPAEPRKVPSTTPDSKDDDDKGGDEDAAAIEDAIDHFFNDPAIDPTGKSSGKGKGKGKSKQR